MENYNLNYEQIKAMKHCIGFTKNKVKGIKYRKYEAYRNYFTTSNNDANLDKLVEQGLMGKRDFKNGFGDNPKLYYVDNKGFEFLGDVMGIEILEVY